MQVVFDMQRFEARPMDACGRALAVGDCVRVESSLEEPIEPVVGIGDGCVFTASAGRIERRLSRDVRFISASEVLSELGGPRRGGAGAKGEPCAF